MLFFKKIMEYARTYHKISKFNPDRSRHNGLNKYNTSFCGTKCG